MKYLALIFSILTFNTLIAQDNLVINEPVELTYKVVGSDSLKAYVFFPDDTSNKEEHPSIVIFHGGGWAMGEPSWGFRHAKKYAKLGLVSIVAQYRLSDEKNITPIEAMADSRDLILWMRENPKELKISKDSIAAYGWSAGAHLAASSAVFPGYNSDSSLSSIPNALILHSPALSLVNDGWFKKLLMGKGEPIDFSPAENIKGSMPTSIIVVGEDDTVTPVEGSTLFHKNMLKYGNTSYLHVYDSVGHLFTPSGQRDNGRPNPDKKVSAKAFNEIDLFFKELGYIK
jgi:acetyl esterase